MTGFYDQLAEDYDRIIRWERRLKNEAPLFLRMWQRFGTRSVLDASCGTGHHLNLFAQQELECHGADVSAEMVRLARANTAGTVPPERIVCVPWHEADRAFPRRFDAVLCIGNSLPYVTDRAMLDASLRALWNRVAPAGFLLVQFKNFARLQQRGQRFLPVASADKPRETVALRIYDYVPGHIDFNVVILDREGPGAEWRLRHQATPLQPWMPGDISPTLAPLGASITLHASLALDPFDGETSEDIVILARKET